MAICDTDPSINYSFSWFQLIVYLKAAWEHNQFLPVQPAHQHGQRTLMLHNSALFTEVIMDALIYASILNTRL